MIRYDFAMRINDADNEPLGSAFFSMFRNAGSVSNVRFSGRNGILSAWQRNFQTLSGKIDNYVAILELRHWLAHGRWWRLDPALHISVADVKRIVEEMLDAMGLNNSTTAVGTP